MILRKPYAFLIKNFKRIHLVLGVILSFLLFKTYQIYSFFGEYVTEGWFGNSNVIISDYITIYIFVFIILSIAIFMIILALFFQKKKPRAFYIFSLIAYVYVLIVYFVDLNGFNVILKEIIDARYARMIRDLTFIAMVFQFITALFVLFRSTGFNLKKFDFEKDMKQLQIEEVDREEVEVSLSVDKNLIKRKLLKQKRRFKYFVIENTAVFLTLLGIFAISLGTYIYLNIEVYDKIYNEGEKFVTDEGIFNVTGSYYTIYNYNGDAVGGDALKYFVVKFHINNNSESDVSLGLNNFLLYIDYESYIPVLNRYVSMFDIGEGYYDQIISVDEEDDFILVFEVPLEFSTKNIYLRYIDSVNQVKYYELDTNKKTISLKPFNLENVDKISFYSLGEDVVFNTDYISDVKLNITAVEYNNSFTVGDEVIKANTLSNYDKTLMKLTYTYESEYNEISDIGEFIEKFGNIQYEIDGKYYSHVVSLIDMTPVGSKDMYFEVLEKVKTANKVDLVFNFRGDKYIYTIKGESEK